MTESDGQGATGHEPPPTLGETASALHASLRDYIEAAYHVSHPTLVAERRALLDEPGIISQKPYVESTPRYQAGANFGALSGLAPEVTQLFELLSRTVESGKETLPNRLFDPPYTHQATAMEEALSGRDLVVMTGTGSGKTESFLLPILGKLATEALRHPTRFGNRSGVRALVLYPMNALVNDQLSRIRLLFGDQRVSEFFTSRTGRPVRFARYTSRTPYPGVRRRERDQLRLKFIDSYYLDRLEAGDGSSALVKVLMDGGRWPAKSDLRQWYGQKRQRWTNTEGDFTRCVTLPHDSELVTRHEVHRWPPDILVTNYSMLEYMMLRPLESVVFERTKEWLEASPEDSFVLVLDEAHLYRGAQGAEVGHLIRRLRTRLQIPPERLQVVCTSASFASEERAREFAAQLTGKTGSTFEVISGDLRYRTPEGVADVSLAERLSVVELAQVFAAQTPEERKTHLGSLFEYLGLSKAELEELSLEEAAYRAVSDLPVMGRLVNRTMDEALPIKQLESELFPAAEPDIAARALMVLVTLGTLARPAPDGAPVLPSRVHVFFRGLPGIWACMDAECPEVAPAHRSSDRPCGKLYAQARERCGCGARVLEFFTCRSCGTAYARAYTNDVASPTYLWPEPGDLFYDEDGVVPQLHPIDLLLESPKEAVETADYDLASGRLNVPCERVRSVSLVLDRHVNEDGNGGSGAAGPGAFRPCAVCGDAPNYGKSSVMDHQTRGDQPFQALVTRQLEVQAPAAREKTSFAPLRGRKVLVFSDSRQMAARLAPTLQEYSIRDVVRPLAVAGFVRLQKVPAIARRLTVDDCYFAVMLAATEMDVRLRPPLRQNEGFGLRDVLKTAHSEGRLQDEDELADLFLDERGELPPDSLLSAINGSLFDRALGLQPLALASVAPSGRHTTAILELPELGPATSDQQKVALATIWLHAFAEGSGHPLSGHGW